MSKDFELNGLAAILYSEHLLDKKIAKNAIQYAQQQNIPLTTYLVKAKILASEIILNCCVKNFNLPVFDLKNYDFSWLKNSILNAEMICRYHLVPLSSDKHSLQIGLSDPTDYAAQAALSFHTNLTIHPVLISEEDLDHFINTHCRPNVLYAQLESTLAKMLSVEEKTQEKLPVKSNDPNDEPVIEFVDRLLLDAIEKNVSDIHIEPNANHCRIRFRRDGLLYEAATIPLLLAKRLIMRFKIMANLNIAEKRLPQDGHIKIHLLRKIDLRINTCPTLHGEKLVLRLLDITKINLDINLLGFLTTQQQLFLEKISQPQGLILVTGPTGSGKTISLYSALHFLNQVEKNISTVEDPVEIELPGINQVSINSQIGLGFPQVLRTLLRQDPDIIMIGEIRDQETATIAIQAAQTGHLVLATLHTNNALETITRLQSIGINFYQLINCISLIIAQRLVRQLCNHCKLKHANYYRAMGCDNCHQGYCGRIGIFECLAMNDSIVELILNTKNMLELSAYLKNSNWISLIEAGLDKVQKGITCESELVRVLGIEKALDPALDDTDVHARNNSLNDEIIRSD